MSARFPALITAVLKNDGFEFCYISSRFLELFGYTREEIQTLFHNRLINMIHPDDRAAVYAETEKMKSEKNFLKIKYRMRSSTGYIQILEQTSLLNVNGKECFCGMILNLTETEK